MVNSAAVEVEAADVPPPPASNNSSSLEKVGCVGNYIDIILDLIGLKLCILLKSYDIL